MRYATVLVESQAAVTTITLNRPAKLNALSQQLLGELLEALEAAGRDPQCRCVLLTGAGRGFCAGADLVDTAFAPRPGERLDMGAALEASYHPVLRAIRQMPKPVIAAINGTAAGAGLNIALVCDVVIAARGARLIQSFINIGLVPDAGGSWSIPRLIGRARATRWLMSGEALEAEQAQQWGLLSEVCEADALPAVAADLAASMARQPTRALAAIKQLMDRSWENDLDTQLALEASCQTEVGYSADALEGISAFVQKRPARFTGS